MRYELTRRRILENMINKKNDWLMFRQGVHSAVGILAIFIALIAFFFRGKTGMLMSQCAMLGCLANMLFMLNLCDEMEKFRRQLEGYHRLCP